ncbi:hypothetical protein HAX54_031418 [Datura stramonium]|uniref:Uncharacterized protein n=1 Tax=Datura stramonium TaxID=4076 RepID=A0ABS8VCE3_DATST|nr:hypothetical protein [Datura stramonium]
MNLPDVIDKACLEGQLPPHKGANQPIEKSAAKDSYSDIISSSPNSTSLKSSSADVRQLKEAIKANHTTHNGVLVVMYKASDYYEIMAAECKFMIVGFMQNLEYEGIPK